MISEFSTFNNFLFMKKLLLSLSALAMAAMPMLAETVTITFAKGADNNQSAYTTATEISSVIAEGSAGADILSAITVTDRVSPGQYGLKIGTNKDKGNITFAFADALNVNTITLKVSASKGAQTLDVNGTEYSINGSTNSNANYTTFVNDVNAEISELVLAKTKSYNADGSAQGFIFIESITIDYTPGAVDPDALPKPEITLEGRTVTITCSDPDAQIRYTDFDGADINVDYTVYYVPFDLYMPCTVQAVAQKDGKFSAVATKVCNVSIPIESLSNMYDIYAGGKGMTVEYEGNLTVAGYAKPYLWLTDGMGGYVLIYGYGDTVYTQGETVKGFVGVVDNYNGLNQIKEATVGEKVADAEPAMVYPMPVTTSAVGENMQTSYVRLYDVKISGASRSYTLTDEEGSLAMYDSAKAFTDFVPEEGVLYTVEGFVGVNIKDGVTTVQVIPVKIEKNPVCATPVFTPAAGEYTAATTVTIACETEGATIYYTLDSTDPTVDSTEYTEGIKLNASGEYTIKAIAVAEGCNPSEVATATYKLTLSTGIEAVEAAAAEAEYFNLQGVRVAQPAPGLYIRRAAGKVEKVLVK